MTMAPGQKKKGFWLEILFASILLFLLLGARSQANHTADRHSPGFGGVVSHRTIFSTPASFQ